MLTRSESIAALAKAKAAAQAKFLPLGKDKSATVRMKAGGEYTYTYADLATCLDSVMPALSEAGLALFQPVRVEDGVAVATTLLVHGESGEWLSADYAAIAVDPADARSVGSAATYARRYGLISMLAIAPADEDDDVEAGRGGAHEMAETTIADAGARRPSGRPTCPVCGKQTLFQNRAQRTWFCSKREGGCQTGWPASETPPTAPPHGDVLDLPPGTTTPAQAEAEGDALFPTEAPENAQELLAAITERFKLVKNAIVQERLWKAHCGAAPFLSANVDVAALGTLLAALGGSVAR